MTEYAADAEALAGALPIPTCQCDSHSSVGDREACREARERDHAVQVDALIASGVVRPADAVRAEALEPFIGEDEMPRHLPMGVTREGRGPEDDSTAHHFVCWCSDPGCSWTEALAMARKKGAAEALEQAAADVETALLDEMVPETVKQADFVRWLRRRAARLRAGGKS